MSRETLRAAVQSAIGELTASGYPPATNQAVAVTLLREALTFDQGENVPDRCERELRELFVALHQLSVDLRTAGHPEKADRAVSWALMIEDVIHELEDYPWPG